MATRRQGAFAVCIENGDYEGDLIIGKIYRVVKPARHDGLDDIRVVDESGEDYLYPRSWFVPIDLPVKARRVLTMPAQAARRRRSRNPGERSAPTFHSTPSASA